MHRTHKHRKQLTDMAFIGLALFMLFAIVTVQAHGAELGTTEATETAALPLAGLAAAQTDPVTHPPTDAACISCHSETDAELSFASGETLSVQVDPAVVAASVHGDGADPTVGCSGCHAPVDYQFPHPPVLADTLRAYEIVRASTCEQCHQDPHLTSHPGLESDNPVVCTDCHGSHEVEMVEAWQEAEKTSVCADCHIESGVDLVDTALLTQFVQAGLFAQQQVNNEYCLGCHSVPGQTMSFPNGDVVSITIDQVALHDSVHGANNSWDELACTDCHVDYTYPHEEVTAATARQYELEKNQSCATCHETQHQGAMMSVHQEALEDGNEDSAVCTDCHGAHDTPVPNEPRSRISNVCEQCHSTIHAEYAESVHGAALLEDDNPDVPTCIDCHGVHNIGDPTTALFRNQSPQLCATCHADEELMAQYDISTNVFNTYVDDFHGTTVVLFESDDPMVETNKAVCFDCHGVHNIKSPDDPDANLKENLLVTCQQCHPDATDDFSDSWLGHHEPSLTNNPLMWLVQLFYAIVIPTTVGVLGFLVATDVYRKVRGR